MYEYRFGIGKYANRTFGPLLFFLFLSKREDSFYFPHNKETIPKKVKHFSKIAAYTIRSGMKVGGTKQDERRIHLSKPKKLEKNRRD